MSSARRDVDELRAGDPLRQGAGACDTSEVKARWVDGELGEVPAALAAGQEAVSGIERLALQLEADLQVLAVATARLRVIDCVVRQGQPAGWLARRDR